MTLLGGGHDRRWFGVEERAGKRRAREEKRKRRGQGERGTRMA
jgi:hypothetical protein